MHIRLYIYIYILLTIFILSSLPHVSINLYHSQGFPKFYFAKSGPGSSVGIATGYGLDGPGNRIPVGVRFSTPVQTGPGAHPASCTMGTGSFPGVRSSLGVTLTPDPLLVPLVKKE